MAGWCQPCTSEEAQIWFLSPSLSPSGSIPPWLLATPFCSPASLLLPPVCPPPFFPPPLAHGALEDCFEVFGDQWPVAGCVDLPDLHRGCVVRGDSRDMPALLPPWDSVQDILRTKLFRGHQRGQRAGSLSQGTPRRLQLLEHGSLGGSLCLCAHPPEAPQRRGLMFGPYGSKLGAVGCKGCRDEEQPCTQPGSAAAAPEFSLIWNFHMQERKRFLRM